MGFLSNNYSELSLDSVNIQDLVPTGDKCRFIVKIVSMLDLQDLYALYSSQGSDAYDPKIMLTTWFYAYSEGISSSCVLEELCKYDLRYIYVSANLRPDHSTLCRFRQRSLNLMAEYFVQIVKLMFESDISDFKEINIDGTKLRAFASKKQSKNASELSKKLKKVRKRIQEYIIECESTDLEEDELELLQTEKTRLEKLGKKIVERQKQLEERKETLKSEHREKHKINIIEPDARMMPKSDGPSYNAQVSVDSKTRLIIANDVVTDPNDQNQFSNMHQKSESNIGSDSDRKHNTDAGYHSLEQLDYSEKNHVDVIMPDPSPENRSIPMYQLAEEDTLEQNSTPTSVETILQGERKLRRADFVYNAKENYYECPYRKKLEPGGRFNNGKRKGTVYKSPGCQGCPLVKFCVSNNKSGIKHIYRDEREVLAEKMSQKLQTHEARERLKTRACTVETVFGNIKGNIGFRRFHLRDLEKVKEEFNLMCIAHNLNMLFNLVPEVSIFLFFLAKYFQFYVLYAILTISKIRKSFYRKIMIKLFYGKP